MNAANSSDNSEHSLAGALTPESSGGISVPSALAGKSRTESVLKGAGQAFLLFLASRLALYLLAYLSVVIYPGEVQMVSGRPFESPGAVTADVMNMFCQFDCKWFMSIAISGYETYPSHLTTGHAANWAFLPLYPLLGRYLADLSGGNILPAFYLISGVCSYLGLLLWIYLLKMFRLSYETRLAGAFFYCFLPYSVYFIAPYTESLFMMFTIAAFILAMKERYLCAALCAMAMVATKNIGVMFVFPLAILFWQHNGFRAFFNFRSLKTAVFWLSFMLVPLPMFVFQNWLWYSTGDALAFKNIQLAWGRMMGNPFMHMLEGFGTGGYKAYFAAFFAGCFLPIAYLFFRKRYAEGVFLLLGALVPVSTGVNAIPRYMFGMMPMLLAFTLMTEGRPWFRDLLLTLSGMLAVFISIAWVHGEFFTV